MVLINESAPQRVSTSASQRHDDSACQHLNLTTQRLDWLMSMSQHLKSANRRVADRIKAVILYDKERSYADIAHAPLRFRPRNLNQIPARVPQDIPWDYLRSASCRSYNHKLGGYDHAPKGPLPMSSLGPPRLMRRRCPRYQVRFSPAKKERLAHDGL